MPSNSVCNHNRDKQIGLRSSCAVVRFCYYSYDYKPTWTPHSPIAITYILKSKHLFAFFITSTAAAAHASPVFLCSHRELQLCSALAFLQGGRHLICTIYPDKVKFIIFKISKSKFNTMFSLFMSSLDL